ncbi:ATP-binding protein [Exiguobacterium sp. RIT594]|uniref:ATP-binding protein n=1 Tax=Exiguobacterium sp. RIT594 TaxID=2282449 RepID=UPI000DF81D9B|nr:ATP-binding protein [Exiguobacterium sp. RIT594]RDB34576.1 histidine kinase [Exiguobacterium sp. RIT594]
MKQWMTEKLGRQLMAVFYSVFVWSVLTSVASYLYIDNSAGQTKEQVLAQLQQTQWFWFLNLLIFLLCLLFIVRPLIGRLTMQLHELNIKSQRLAEGKSISLEHDVLVENEVGQLTESFYRMARSISSQHTELSRKNQLMEQNQEALKSKQTELEQALEVTRSNELHLQDRNELIETLASKESLFDYSSVISTIVRLTKTEFGALLLIKNNEISSVVPKEMTEEQQESLKTESLLLKRVMISKERANSSKKVANDSLIGFPYYIYEAVIPVMDQAKDELIACLYLARFDQSFNTKELNELESFSKQIAISLMRMSLYEQMEYERKETAQLLNSVREAILYIKHDEKTILGNQALFDIFESLQIEEDNDSMTFLEVRPETMFEQVDQKEAFEAYFEEVLSGQIPEGMFSLSIDQGEYFIQVYAEEIMLSEQAKGTILVFRDVTAETEVDRMKSELVSTVSHELRTPLSSIYGFTELMLKRKLDPERNKRYLQTIHDESKRLTDLVSDFLNVQRMESGKQSYDKEVFDLIDTVREQTRFYQASTEQHRLQLDVDENHEFLIHADKNSMKQLLGNLLHNAIKYSPDGGAVVISLTHHHNQIELSVRDFGLGIPSSAMPHLFSKFYRVDNSDSRKIGGTGLGLSICKEIVRAHDGNIDVESILGEGTVFKVLLPSVSDTLIEMD